MSSNSSLESALARLEEWAKHSEQAQKKADEDRKEMMRQLQIIAGIQAQLVSDMREVKPVTDMVQTVRSKISGALIALGFVGAVFWAAISFFKDQLLAFGRFLTGG